MRTLTVFVLLSVSVLYAQTGTITAITVEGATGCSAAPACNGGVIDITTTGLGTGGTYSFGLGANNNPYVGTPKVVLTVTGNIYGSASTGNRTVYGTLWMRKPYPNNAVADEAANGGNAIIRIALSDYIYSGESVSAVIAAGLYTDTGSHSSLSYSGAVTNNSTQAYSSMKPVGRWATVPYQRVSGAFTVEAAVFHRYGQQGRPVYSVAFTCSDGTNSSTQTTYTPTISALKSQYGDQYPVIVYASTFNASTFVQAATITCNFQAYPWVGDSTAILDSSVTTGPISNATKNAGGSGYAVNDTFTVGGCATAPTGRVLTVSTGAVSTFTIYYRGLGCSTATGATTIATSGVGTGFTVNTAVFAGAPAAGSALNSGLGPLYFLDDRAGTYGAAYAVVDATNGHNSTANTWVAASQATAESNYGSSSTNSYTTIGNAVQACKAFNNANYAHNDPGGCTIELVSTNNTYPGTTVGSDLGNMATWFTITRLSTLTSAQAGINAGTIATLNTRLVHVQGITISGSSTAIMYDGTTKNNLWVDSCVVNTTATNTFYAWKGAAYATGNTLTAVGGALGSSSQTPFVLVRGNAVPSTSVGSVINSYVYCIIGNKNVGVQWPIFSVLNTFGIASSDGCVVAYNSIYFANNANGVIGITTDTPEIVQGAAIIQNVLEQTAAQLGMGVWQNSTSNETNVIIWHNTLMGGRIDQAFNYQQSGVTECGTAGPCPLYMFQWSYVGNLWDNYNYNGDSSTPAQANNYGNILMDYSIGQRGNVKRATAGIAPSWCGAFRGLMTPLAGCTGTTTTISFVSDASYNEGNGGSAAGNGNYHLRSGTIAGNLMFPGNSCVLPYDLDGNKRNCSGYGSAGAFEQAVLLTPAFGW